MSHNKHCLSQTLSKRNKGRNKTHSSSIPIMNFKENNRLSFIHHLKIPFIINFFKENNRHLITATTTTIAVYIYFLLCLPFTTAQSGDDEPGALSDIDNDLYHDFNPSITIMLVVMVVAFFLKGFISIYTNHCTNVPSNNVRIHDVTESWSLKAARGLDQAVMETFPILEYWEVKIHKIGKEALECAVCLSEFEDSDTLRLIPKCDHVFHPACIDEWLSSHTTCPVCRANLVPQPGESVHALPIQNNLDSARHIEVQNDTVIEIAPEITEQQNAEAISKRVSSSDPKLVILPPSNNKTLNRTRTWDRSNRPRKFPRSHSTGHSLVQPVEDTERFTLRLPLEVRKRMINRQLQCTNSFILLPNRTDCEGSSRGKISNLLNLSFKKDRWVFTMHGF